MTACQSMFTHLGATGRMLPLTPAVNTGDPRLGLCTNCICGPRRRTDRAACIYVSQCVVTSSQCHNDGPNRHGLRNGAS